MITINVADLPILTAEQAAFEADGDASEFAQPGLYRILIGSRGIVDEVTFIGNDSTFQIPTLDEVVEEYAEVWGLEDAADEYFEEFYGYSIDAARGLEFGFTEEDYELYVRVG